MAETPSLPEANERLLITLQLKQVRASLEPSVRLESNRWRESKLGPALRAAQLDHPAIRRRSQLLAALAFHDRLFREYVRHTSPRPTTQIGQVTCAKTKVFSMTAACPFTGSGSRAGRALER